MATSGALTTGVKPVPPTAPRLDTVKLPPCSSSGLRRRSRAAVAKRVISSVNAKAPNAPASRTTGTMSPSSVSTAMPMWW